MKAFKMGAAVLAMLLLAGCGIRASSAPMAVTGGTDVTSDAAVTDETETTESTTVTEATEEVGATESSAETTAEVTTEEIPYVETEPVTEPPVVTEAPVTASPIVTEAPPATLPEPKPEPVTAPETEEQETPEISEPQSSVTSKGYRISVVNGVTYVDGVLIANKTYALPETYAPGGLTAETLSAFTQMQSAAAKEGITLFVKSGYRSYYDQRYIYANYAAIDGAAAADRYSARAGHSEHQSGMAIDVNSLYLSFADTPEGIWLKNHCAEYGFIIRYPADKESITGYMYEPWHIRYVGRDLARAVTDSGLCLEEYFGITSFYQ